MDARFTNRYDFLTRIETASRSTSLAAMPMTTLWHIKGREKRLCIAEHPPIHVAGGSCASLWPLQAMPGSSLVADVEASVRTVEKVQERTSQAWSARPEEKTEPLTNP
jgi:hypothetical protein